MIPGSRFGFATVRDFFFGFFFFGAFRPDTSHGTQIFCSTIA